MFHRIEKNVKTNLNIYLTNFKNMINYYVREKREYP